MTDLLGYAAAFIMGAVLGGIGSGGSILTVPILVYLLGVPPVTATGYSLLLVGAAASYGAYRYYRQGLIHVKEALIFAVPSILAVYLTRAFLMPAVPDPLLNAPFVIGKDAAVMVLFAVLMILAAAMMLHNSRRLTPPPTHPHHYGLIIIEGAVVGVFTGILGAGGGFLIIPALVLLMGMDMKNAVGSSLLIIALKSLIGFIGDLQNDIALDVPLLGFFAAATFIGMWLATKLAHRFNGRHLQRGFAFFTLLIAAVILYKEIL